jgi:hypothetical protein
MAIQKNQGAQLPNAFPNALTNARHTDAVNAINALDYADLWGAPGTKTSRGTMRVDLQGYTTTGEANLQLQVNGVNGNSSVAGILISPSAQSAVPNRTNGAQVAAQQAEIRRVAVSAFMDSLNNFEQGNPRFWRVTGTPSS